jgi:hypothetical protein
VPSAAEERSRFLQNFQVADASDEKFTALIQRLIDAMDADELSDLEFAAAFQRLRARLDPARIPEILAQLEPGTGYEKPVLSALFRIYTAHDPRAAFELASGQKTDYWYGNGFTSVVLQEWTRLDPLAAWDCAATAPSPTVNSLPRSHLLNIFGSTTPENRLLFWEKIAAMEDTPARAEFLRFLSDNLFSSAEDVEALERRYREIAGDDPHMARTLLLGKLEHTVKSPDFNPEEFIQTVQGIEDLQTRVRAWELLVGAGLEKEELFTLIDRAPSGGIRDQLYISMLNYADPESSREIISRLPPGQARDNALKYFTKEMIREEPLQTWRWLLEEPAGAARENALRTAMQEWPQRDPQAALAAWQKLPEETQATLEPNFLKSWAQNSPEQVAAWLQEGWSNQPTDHLGPVLDTWVKKDPAQARAWFENLEPDWQMAGAEAFIAALSYRDFDAAKSYLNRVPAGPLEDELRSGIVRHAARYDPEETVGIIRKIQEPTLRDEAYVRLGKIWNRMDPPRARDWAENDPQLTPEVRRQLLKSLD